MVERDTALFRRLVFDRHTIVGAALRTYISYCLAQLNRVGIGTSDLIYWAGDLQQGALLIDNSCGDYVVVAWSEAGIVGLAFDGYQGPIEQLGLEVEAVTGGPEDVRGAVLGMPEELELTLVLASGMLKVGPVYGERWAGAGFWLCGDRTGGTLFTAENLTDAWGITRLAAWGRIRGYRLPHACSDTIYFAPDAPDVAPFQAMIDAVVARRLQGPTELTTDELATLLQTSPDPEQLSSVQQSLQEISIRWPGSPDLA